MKHGQLKFIADMKSGEAIEAEAIYDDGKYPVYGGNGHRGYSFTKTHTLSAVPLVGRQGALCGNVNYVQGEFYATEHAIVACPRTGVHSRWLYWTLLNLNLNQYSTAAAQPGLSVDALRRVQTQIPEYILQEQIANFLDEQTARIDALIAAKEQLVAAADELFQARLGTAVVEGLRSSAGFRNASEVGFDNVRVDWTLIPLKYLASAVGGMTPSKDREDFWQGTIPWVSPKDMKRFILHDSQDHISESAIDETALKILPVDSVLIVVRGMILAHTFPVAMNAVPVTINQDMKALRPTNYVSAAYLAWMLRGLQPLVLSLTDESAHGTKALRTDQLFSQAIPVPSAGEQSELVSAFEKWEKESFDLSKHVLEHIARLREYRSSLISAAVTGQLDINCYREAA